LHNLPGILKAESHDLLAGYYYKVDRPAFLAAVKSNADDFQAPWTELANAIGACKSAGPRGNKSHSEAV